MKIENTIYLDHQATTPVDPRVLTEMIPYFVETFGNPHSSDHSMGWKAAQVTERAASAVATLIGADTDEIVFTSGATEANNLALLGIARRAAVSGGKRKRILLGATEHKSVLAAGKALSTQLGYNIEYVPVDGDGNVIIDEYIRLLDDDVLISSIMSVNNEIGTINNIELLSKHTHDAGTILHCDAVQAPCTIDTRNMAAHADFISLSAHKFYGPKGIGALFVRRDLREMIEPLVYGGGQQHNLRAGTMPTPLCVGMGVAARLLASDEAETERAAIRLRRDNFIEELHQLSWSIHVNGPINDRHVGNANIRFDGFSAHDILSALQPNIAASTGSACTTGIPEPSHVLRAIGLTGQEAESSVRFSLGRYTTDEDVQEAVALIDQTLSKLANSGLVASA